MRTRFQHPRCRFSKRGPGHFGSFLPSEAFGVLRGVRIPDFPPPFRGSVHRFWVTYRLTLAVTLTLGTVSNPTRTGQCEIPAQAHFSNKWCLSLEFTAPLEVSENSDIDMSKWSPTVSVLSVSVPTVGKKPKGDGDRNEEHDLEHDFVRRSANSGGIR